MPSYTYKDENGHEVTVVSAAICKPNEIVCGCGLEMYRKFHPTRVNWGGIKPSQERDPVIQHLLDSKDARRDKYEKEKS